MRSRQLHLHNLPQLWISNQFTKVDMKEHTEMKSGELSHQRVKRYAQGSIFHLPVDPNTTYPLEKVMIWRPTSSLQSNWWGLCYWLSGVRLLSKSSVPAASSGCLPLLQTAELPLITVGVLNVDWGQNAIQNLQTQGRRDIWFMNGIFSNLCIYGSFFPGGKKKKNL